MSAAHMGNVLSIQVVDLQSRFVMTVGWIASLL